MKAEPVFLSLREICGDRPSTLRRRIIGRAPAPLFPGLCSLPHASMCGRGGRGTQKTERPRAPAPGVAARPSRCWRGVLPSADAVALSSFH